MSENSTTEISRLEENLTTPFKSQYELFIFVSRYARWIDAYGRRETWQEAVTRYCDFFKEQLGEHYEEVYTAIYNLEVMPSMRAFATAGPALEKDHVAGYNCAYVTVDSPRAFDETVYVLMCGTGVGFSVERQYISKLPTIADEFYETDTVIRVHDSKIGWAKALRELIALLYTGQIPQYDTSAVRPAGAPLKTFGGRASGPKPLEDLFKFVISTFKGAAGRKLNSLECHDIMCKIAQIVVVGGVRRSALLSLSNFSDQRMAQAKNGAWYELEPQRSLSNNSAAYTEKPDFSSFLQEWNTLYQSKSGERGIFNRVAAKKAALQSGRREDADFGCNPCSEIILRPQEFCNLSEVVIKPYDTPHSIQHKVRIATIIGTAQATLTNFRYLRNVWKKNCEEERLLGVSLTGIMDNPHTNNLRGNLISLLSDWREHAVAVNAAYAEKLGIPASAAITCIKPSGTVSQLVDCSSGIHTRYASAYIRRVRGDLKDPLCQMLMDQGVPHEMDVHNPHNVVFSFPKRSPQTSVIGRAYNSIEMLEIWKAYQRHWCEHKPSCTIHYDDSEFLKIGQWIWDNWDIVSGISFLPYSDHIYQQAPYEEIPISKYEKLRKSMPNIDWLALSQYETEDRTRSGKEMACSGNSCEIVDLVN